MKELALVVMLIASLAALGLSLYKVERRCTTATEEIRLGAPFGQNLQRTRTTCEWHLGRR